MIYYGLLDKTSALKGQITYIPGRSAIVKFYIYIIGKAIFCMESIVQWCSSSF